MTAALQNCHHLFSNNDLGYWYQTRPTKVQVEQLLSCQEKIRDCLTEALHRAYGIKPKFRVQGSWAYGTCNQPAQAGQEMDLDYGAYLPSSVFSAEKSPEEATAYFQVAKYALSTLCDYEGWELNEDKPMCLRLHKVMKDAHIDVPLYAVPNDMFEELKENHKVAFDSIQKSEANFADASVQFGIESYDGVMLNENVRSRAKEIDLDSIQIIHMAMQTGEWKASDCEKVREWFLQNCLDTPNKGQQLKAIVRYLKGWRDQMWETGGPTSILLMIITVQKYQYFAGRDDLALQVVTSELAHALRGDVFENDIDGHSTENFNRSNPQQRLENSNKANELHLFVSAALAAETPEQSVDNLRDKFGERLPDAPELVRTDTSMSVTVGRVAAYAQTLNQPVQRVREAAMLAPEIGG